MSRQRLCMSTRIQIGRRMLTSLSRPQVFDEFEIDPRQNEGASYQFHDVKRRKLERKQMHGGDCECCKDVSYCSKLKALNIS